MRDGRIRPPAAARRLSRRQRSASRYARSVLPSEPIRRRDAGASQATRVVDEAEIVAARLRLQRVLFAALVLWSASTCSDVLNATGRGPGLLGHLLEIRAVGLVGIGVVIISLRAQRRLSRRALRAFASLGFTAIGVLVSMMAILTGGVTSPYFGGVMLVLVVYGATVNDHWRRGIIDVAGPMLAYPLTMLAGAARSPTVAAQLGDRASLQIFLSNLGNLCIAYAALVLSGHMVWALRRQVFEARSLGRYKLKQLLGAGGMGEVWLAHHAALRRDVAVKILRVEQGLDAQVVARFEREVRATTELVHPNTVRVFDYGVSDDGIWYYAMELLDGENLGTLVAREGALPPARALHLVVQASRALAEAHAKGIVHRDVKPENLFVVLLAGERDFIKVLDFGIAQVRAPDTKLTATGSVVGTPQWLAPETIRGDEIDARADVYALGAVLYFLLAARPPFEGSSALALAHATLFTPASSPSARRVAPLPADLEAVVMRCLEKDPAARFASARELAHALEACADAGSWTWQDAQRAAEGSPKGAAATSPFAPTALDASAPTEAIVPGAARARAKAHSDDPA